MKPAVETTPIRRGRFREHEGERISIKIAAPVVNPPGLYAVPVEFDCTIGAKTDRTNHTQGLYLGLFHVTSDILVYNEDITENLYE